MFQQLKVQSKDFQSWLFCFENTGAYSKPIFEWLFNHGIPCLEECPIKIKKSLGIKRGKDDKADSKAICNYAFEKRDSISPSKPDTPLITKLKCLISRREQLVKVRTGLTLSVRNIHLTQDKATTDYIIKENQSILDLINHQIKTLELDIQSVLDLDEKMKKNNQLLQSLIGIGPVLAVKLIVTTNNFENFSNARKYACYCGIAPFPNSSGRMVKKTKVSHIANKNVKSILSQAVISSITHDPELRVYYHRKVQDGKPKGLVLNAVKNKLIQRAFAVIKRQSPYLKMMKYAS